MLPALENERSAHHLICAGRQPTLLTVPGCDSDAQSAGPVLPQRLGEKLQAGIAPGALSAEGRAGLLAGVEQEWGGWQEPGHGDPRKGGQWGGKANAWLLLEPNSGLG